MHVSKKFLNVIDILYSNDNSEILALLNLSIRSAIYLAPKDAIIIHTGVSCLYSYENGETGQCDLYFDIRNIVLIRVPYLFDKPPAYWDRNAASRMLGLLFCVDEKGKFQPTQSFIQNYDERYSDITVTEFQSDVQRMFLLYGLNYSAAYDDSKRLPISNENNSIVEALENSMAAKYGYSTTHYNCGVDLMTKMISHEEFISISEGKRREEIEVKRNEPDMYSHNVSRSLSQAEELDQIWRDEMDSFGMSDVELDRT